MTSHPGVVAGFITAHFLNAEIANVLVLPIRDGLAAPAELWMPSTAFWEAWDGSFSAGQGMLFAVYLGLIALGVGACWARLGWAGLLPLAANLSYNLSMSLARNSGGRYLLAVDWIGYFYAAVGLMEIVLVVVTLGGAPLKRISGLVANRAGDQVASFSLSKAWPAVLRIGLLFLFLGSILPLAERLAPVRYPERNAAVLLDEAGQAAGIDRAELEAFTAQPGAVLVKGRGLYPRYYAAGEGEPRTAKTGYEPLDYGRLLFQMVSPGFNGLVMLKTESQPGYFPNAVDVLVAGCYLPNASGGVVYPGVVVVESPSRAVYASEEGASLDCSSISSSRQ